MLRREAFGFVKGFHNRHRMHSAFGATVPMLEWHHSTYRRTRGTDRLFRCSGQIQADDAAGARRGGADTVSTFLLGPIESGIGIGEEIPCLCRSLRNRRDSKRCGYARTVVF